MSTTHNNGIIHIYHSIQVRAISHNSTEIRLSGVLLLKWGWIEVYEEEVNTYLWPIFKLREPRFKELWAFEVYWENEKKSKIFPEIDIA